MKLEYDLETARLVFVTLRWRKKWSLSQSTPYLLDKYSEVKNISFFGYMTMIRFFELQCYFFYWKYHSLRILWTILRSYLLPTPSMRTNFFWPTPREDRATGQRFAEVGRSSSHTAKWVITIYKISDLLSLVGVLSGPDNDMRSNRLRHWFEWETPPVLVSD